MSKLVIPGFRGRLVFDSYLLLKDGEGRHKAVRDNYIDLAKERGLPLPKKKHAKEPCPILQGIKDEVHRNSSDSKVYINGGWYTRRPDMYYKVEEGRWGIRENALDQVNKLNFTEQPSLLASIIPSSPNTDFSKFIVDDLVIDEQALYIIRMIPSYPLVVTDDLLVVKIGKGKEIIDQRMKSLQTGNPCTLKPLMIVNAYHVDELEKKLHHQFENYQMQGGTEWFSLTIEQYFDAAKSMAAHNLFNSQ